MEITGKVCVVTGGASGIGKALAEEFHKQGARGIVIADLNGEGAKAVAASVGGVGMACDVAKEADIEALVALARETYGQVDIFVSNAGIVGRNPDRNMATSAPNEVWEQAWGVNVMAHVYAARAVLPEMIARKEGYFLNTVSAAGLLSQIGSAVYSTTKHAAIGFAENLAITHKDDGIEVGVLCPQAVDTPLLGGAKGSQSVDGVLTPEYVAEFTVKAVKEGRFLILPHEQVLTYMRRKTDDYQRWIGGMAKLRRNLIAAG